MKNSYCHIQLNRYNDLLTAPNKCLIMFTLVYCSLLFTCSAVFILYMCSLACFRPDRSIFFLSIPLQLLILLLNKNSKIVFFCLHLLIFFSSSANQIFNHHHHHHHVPLAAPAVTSLMVKH